MTFPHGGVDNMSAPQDYDAFHRQWYSYVVSLVRRNGIDEDGKEDVASSILMRLFERDFLTWYDPNLVFKYNGEDRPAKFKSFLSKLVLVYLRSHREKQNRRRTRELLICDTPVGEDGDRPWVEVYGGQVPSHEATLIGKAELAEAVAGLRAHLLAAPTRGERDMCDPVALFDAVVEQIAEIGQYDVAALTERFNTSATSMHTWLWRLKEMLADATQRQVPAKRPRVLHRPDPPGDAGDGDQPAGLAA